MMTKLHQLICAFFGHAYKITKRDDEYDCHERTCVYCGKKTIDDPYAGLAG